MGRTTLTPLVSFGLVVASGLAFTAPALAQATFAPSTDTQYIADLEFAFERQFGGDRFVGGAKWTLDSRGTVAYSYVREIDGGAAPVVIPAQAGLPGDTAGNNTLFTTLDAQFGDRFTWQAIIDQAFARWGTTSDVSFEFRRHTVPDVPGENPLIDNWDDSDNWATTGPLAGVTTVERGDIRIGMRPIDGPGGIIAYSPGPASGGDIILDSQEDWATTDFDSGSATFAFFDNAISRAIGSAVGLLSVCPDDGTKLMEPELTFGFIGPQHDDIRGAHSLYGDIFEPNNDRTLLGSTSILFSPGLFGTGQSTFTFTNLSIGEVTDVDVFRVTYSDPADIEAFITVSPVGLTYEEGPIVGGECNGASFNSLAVYNLKLGVFDDEGNPLVDPITSTDGFLNENPAGGGERTSVTFPSGGGTFYIVVDHAGGIAAETQLFDISIVFESEITSSGGIAFHPAINDGLVQPSPNMIPAMFGGISGHNAASVFADGFTGTRAVYANVESSQPNPDHIVFFGRPFTTVAWDGLNPAIDVIASHATAATGSAAGRAFGPVPDTAFSSPAPDAQLISSAVASALFGGGSFLISVESLYYGLFAVADPDLAEEAGLAAPATVINSSWGGIGDFRGDGRNAIAYDAAVSMLDVTIVASAGNEGNADAICNGGSGDFPGGTFRGSRTIGSPATAFNTISVGAAGKLSATGTEDPRTLFFDTVVDFSSKGPIDSFDWENFDLETSTRSGVDILAAGTGLLTRAPDSTVVVFDPPCTYPGHQPVAGSGLVLPDFVPTDNGAFQTIGGTSFASPTVAGAVALLQDVGLAQPLPMSIHPTVMKAVLLTGARKLEGWSNSGQPGKPQDNRDGPDVDSGLVDAMTDQPLDFAQGAGVLDIKRSYEIYFGGYPQFDVQTDGFCLNLFFTHPTTRDVPATDPDVPTITDPFLEPDPPNGPSPIPGGVFGPPAGGGAPGLAGITDAHRPFGPAATPGSRYDGHGPNTSPIEIARKIRASQEGLNEAVIQNLHIDFGDLDLSVGGTSIGPAGAPFTARQPSRPPHSVGPFPGIGIGPPPFGDDPVEIAVITVEPMGWDIGNVGARDIRQPTGNPDPGGYIDYHINEEFLPDDVFIATLCWNRTLTIDQPDFSNPDDPQIGGAIELELENLDLELYPASQRGEVFPGVQPIASSTSEFNNVEHIVWNVDRPGNFVLRVRWVETEYDVFDNLNDADVVFGVAWRLEPPLICVLDMPPAPALRGPSAGTSGLTQLLSAFGAQAGEFEYHPAFDFNRDGVIGTADLLQMLKDISSAQEVGTGVIAQDTP